MKTTLIILTMAFTLTSFSTKHTSAIDSSEKMALQVVHAFQRSSLHEYMALFPSLDEFHQIMQDNSRVYGKYINEAKDEFAIKYNSELVPSLIDAFENVFNEGKKRGIDWNTIKYSGIEWAESKSSLSPGTCTIAFSSKGKEHRLVIEKTFNVNGQWKVSQFIKLI